MEAFGTIFLKVIVIFLLAIVGYVLTRSGLLSERGATDISNLLVKAVTPCVIINAFLQSKGNVEVTEMAYALANAIIAISISIIIGRLSFRKAPPERKTVLQFSVTFSNVGFMGLPLVQGIVGDKGVVYASFGVVAFNVISWTYGYRMMNSQAKLKLRTVLLNPGVIGLLIGLPLYFINFDIPSVLTEPVSMLSALNTPLAMIILGSYVAKLSLQSFISDASVYQMAALRLLLAPSLFLAVMMLLRPEKDLLVSGIIQAATPVAANCVLFSVQYKKDTLLASKCVAVTTVLSVITIPIFSVLAQWYTGFY